MQKKVKNSPDWAIIAGSLLFHNCEKIELSDNTCISTISRAIKGISIF